MKSLYHGGMDVVAGLYEDILGAVVNDMTSVRSGATVIRPGDTGAAVSFVQWKLGVPTSGTYDAATRKAVEAFQLSNFVSDPYGTIGRDTAAALDKLTQPLAPHVNVAPRPGQPQSTGTVTTFPTQPPIEKAKVVYTQPLPQQPLSQQPRPQAPPSGGYVGTPSPTAPGGYAWTPVPPGGGAPLPPAMPQPMPAYAAAGMAPQGFLDQLFPGVPRWKVALGAVGGLAALAIGLSFTAPRRQTPMLPANGGAR